MDFQHHIEHLNQLQPTILSAPASVLLQLARKKQLMIKPQKIVSVAEVLEPQDQVLIEQAFECRGFTSISMHRRAFLLSVINIPIKSTMNDSLLIVEKEWLDEYRFIPIITDLFRSSQPIRPLSP